MRRGACLACLFLLTACGGGAGSMGPPASNPGGGSVAPPVNSGGTPRGTSSNGGVIPQSAIETIPVSTTQVGGVATASDGSFWYTSPISRNGQQDNAIVQVTAAGSVTTFHTPSAASAPEGITLARDGNLYAAEEQTGAIVRILPSGQMTEFVIPRSLDTSPNVYQVGTGPDGNVWFLDVHNSTLGEFNITTETFSSFSLAAPISSGSYVINGPDNNLWVSYTTPNHQGNPPFLRYTTSGTLLSQYPTYPTPTGFLASGPDGNVWATTYQTTSNGQVQDVAAIKITTAGSFEVFPPPGSQLLYGYLGQIVAGGDGNMYVGAQEGQLLQISTATDQYQVFTLPASCPGDQLAWLSPAPDRKLWAYDINLNQVDLIDLKSI